MADRKIFAGPRVKRARMALDLSQTAMAKELEISASYLNLIERNQRPLTVQLIMKLSKTFNITPEELQGDNDGTIEALKAVFSDALLKGELPGYEELFELADVAPNVANGIQKLHEGYRQALDQLSEMNTMLAEGGADLKIAHSTSPHDQVFQAMAERSNYYDALDRAAEYLVAPFEQGRGLWANLIDWLAVNKRITVQLLPEEAMPEWRRRYDKHSMRLFVSDRLSSSERDEELASMVADLALQHEIESAVMRLNLKDPIANELAQDHMTRYAALAMMMPYKRFAQTAARIKYDVTALAGRFNVSFARAAKRLTSLGRPKMEGVPFFLVEADAAGNHVSRLGSNGFPRIEFGGRCPKLNLHRCFVQSHAVMCEQVELPSGEMFVTLAKAGFTPDSVERAAAKHTATMLVCAQADIGKTVYADRIGPQVTLIGPTCRLCERPHCAGRAEAPITRPVDLNTEQRSVSDYEFKT